MDEPHSSRHRQTDGQTDRQTDRQRYKHVTTQNAVLKTFKFLYIATFTQKKFQFTIKCHNFEVVLSLKSFRDVDTR